MIHQLFCFLLLGELTLALSTSSSSRPPTSSTILVVGAGGGTGLRALEGLVDVGFAPSQIRVLSRNSEKLEKLQAKKGFSTCVGDLEDVASLTNVVAGCSGCYLHSASSDTKQLDEGAERRTRNLARAIQEQGDIKHVVFNSAVGEPNHGVARIEHQQRLEKVFQDEFPDIAFTSLRANLFMEELWKSYTRPAILKGKFPFSIPSDRRLYLTSVKDMGRLAGACLQTPETTVGRTINVAGDVLTAREVADAFATAQGSPCVHSRGRLLALLARLFFRDLFQIIRFYRRSTETTDIETLQQEFPGQLTSFPEFLRETNWGDSELTFEDLSSIG